MASPAAAEVVPGPAAKDIVSVTSPEEVVASATGQEVVAVIGFGVAFEAVTAVLSADPIRAGSPQDGVRAGAAIHRGTSWTVVIEEIVAVAASGNRVDSAREPPKVDSKVVLTRSESDG